MSDVVDLKKKNKKKKKKSNKKKRLREEEVEVEEPVEGDKEEEEVFPFNADPDDHCETPLEAYEDICMFLDLVCKKLGKDRSQLVIYDPYYCNGTVKQHLSSLGFTHVINEKKDCYAEWHNKVYDVLLTNPPYSADHLERLCDFLSTNTGYVALLVPNFVHKKPYHKKLENFHYLVPFKRYVFAPPKGLRQKVRNLLTRVQNVSDRFVAEKERYAQKDKSVSNVVAFERNPV